MSIGFLLIIGVGVVLAAAVIGGLILLGMLLHDKWKNSK